MSLNATCQPEFICSDIGILLPLINESIWGIGFRSFIYLFGLLWSFMAIALVADAFMCAIEVITSQTTEASLYFIIFDQLSFNVFNSQTIFVLYY